MIAAMPGKENDRLGTYCGVLQGPSGKSLIPLAEKPHNYTNDIEKSKQGHYSKQPVNAKDLKASASYNASLSKKNGCEVILIDDDEETKSGSESSTISRTRNLHVEYREVDQVVKKTAGSNDFVSCEMLLRQQNALEKELETKRVNLFGFNNHLLRNLNIGLFAVC